MADDDEDGLIERYLLGRLEEGERLQVEEKIMADTEFFNRVLLAEDEMVEKYVQRKLPESDRTEFEASFLSTPEGRQQVSLARALREYVKPSPEPQGETGAGKVPRLTDHGANEIETFSGGTNAGGTVAEDSVLRKPPRAGDARLPAWWRQPAFRWAAVAVIVVGLGLGIYPVIRPSWALSRGLAALNKAYLKQRPIEPRISGLEYASTSATRGDASKQVDTRSLNRAERILLDEAADHPSSASHHALGRLYLAELKFDEAIKEFDEALQTDPNNAQLHSDYGAALLEKGRGENDESKRLELSARALEQFHRALELDGSVLEAIFNRALCYVDIGLPDKATESLHQYLEKDPNSGWAVEARHRLQELEDKKQKASATPALLYEEFVRAYQARDDATSWQALRQARSRSGNSITERLLGSFLDRAEKGGAEEAQSYLRMASYAAEVEYRKTADQYPIDLTRFYEAALPVQRRFLTEGRRLMSIARDRIGHNEYEQAVQTFSKAKAMFERAGDTCEAKLAEVLIGFYKLRIEPKASLRVLEPLPPISRSEITVICLPKL